ncbi:hypothetical protein AX774_g1330 [Zancudomyces culisetae]|uniref:Uncharacterized protein n=1 Tax=Zancudomyces culisetae TaxID=1213189 RepID=A0A1R1PVV9_ZANCU|nr:hypothetical protein AX774_g1330 [Zancudomyces culisetae]|eukprot:OMH85110.1 hypothetical protein AX774_g1330 [Zancudomyces culisetae]
MKDNHSLSTSSTNNVRKNTSNRVKNGRKSPVFGSGRIAIERLLNSLASSGDEHSRNSSEHCGSSNSDSDSDSDIHLSSHTTPEINSKNNTASYFDILVDANPHIDNNYCDNNSNSNDNNKGDENNDENSDSNNSEQNNENNESCSFDSNNNSYHARCTSIHDMNLPTPYHAHSPMSVSTSTSFTHTSPTFSEPSPPARLEYFQSPHAEIETSTGELNENKSKVGNSYSPNLSPKSYQAPHFYFDHNIGYACGIKNRQSTFNNLQFENYSKNNDVYEAHVDTITLTNSNENINSDITNTNRHSSIQFILE